MKVALCRGSPVPKLYQLTVHFQVCFTSGIIFDLKRKLQIRMQFFDLFTCIKNNFVETNFFKKLFAPGFTDL